MGKEDKTGSELFEDSTLIDFLYVDKERVDSLISQIRNGTLRSVTKTTGTSEGSSISGNGSVGVVSGKYFSDNKSNEKSEEYYDPYHSQLINLLNDLAIPSLVEFPNPCIGKLVVIEAPIKIRDMRSIKSLMPMVTKNLAMFKIPQDKDTRKGIKLMQDMIFAMDDAIELSIPFLGTPINGTLREGCLSIKQSDLNRTYGVDLPGKWYTLGILDVSSTQLTVPSDDAKTLEDFVDICSKALNQFYSSTQYSITPILIYRTINY
ncbi:DUF6414 family protein [Megasphaera sueciensis]|uniref:DUF6414 family protein n=1 Tax=Megasphaera sueciensis TaxID=349094 RepID=UPI003D04717E